MGPEAGKSQCGATVCGPSATANPSEANHPQLLEIRYFAYVFISFFEQSRKFQSRIALGRAKFWSRDAGHAGGGGT